MFSSFKIRFTAGRSWIWNPAKDCIVLCFLLSFKAEEAFILLLYLANCFGQHQLPLESVKLSYSLISFCVHDLLKEAPHTPEQAIKSYLDLCRINLLSLLLFFPLTSPIYTYINYRRIKVFCLFDINYLGVKINELCKMFSITHS